MTNSIFDEREWPSNGDLRELGREASEHRRSWALVGGLSRRLLSERTRLGPSSEEQSERIHALEQKIVKQRKFLAQLEECRAFERETEALLVEALGIVLPFTKGDVNARLQRTLAAYEQRKGPRSQEADAEA
jgi:hypothetical protein